MTAANGYVWFLPSWFPPNWYDTEQFNNRTESVPCTKKEMIEAINGHLSLQYKFFADNDSIMQENIPVYKWRENYEKTVANKVSFQNVLFNIILRFLYIYINIQYNHNRMYL